MSDSSTNPLKKIAKHSVIYGIGIMLRRITGFVMLPIYTRYLTPTDYGVVELLTMVIEITGILVGLRISQALFRYYILGVDENEKKTVISTILITGIVMSGFGVAGLYLGAETLAILVFGDSGYHYELQLFAFTLITNLVVTVCLSYIRVRQKPVLFVTVGIVSLVIQVTLNIIFVVILDLHVRGVIYSALISGLIISVSLGLYVFTNVGLHFSRDIFSKLIKFIMPLIIASIGAFYVAYADKYFLRVFGSLADVGLYSLAGRVCSVLLILFEIFNLSWGVDRFEIVKLKNAKEIYDQVFRFLSAIVLLAGYSIVLFANDFFWIMTDPKFYSAGDIVPILVLASMFRIFAFFCNFGIYYREKTRYIAEASWVKVIISTLAFILLIPQYGVIGAAVALVISNLVEFLWIYRRSTSLYNMELSWFPVGIMGAVIIVLAPIGIWFPIGEINWFFARVGVLLFIIIIFYKMPIWSDNERHMMGYPARKIKHFLKGAIR